MTHTPPVVVLPSLPAPSLEEHQRVAQALAGTATQFQIDLVDGIFVDAVSWPFGEAKQEWVSLLETYAPTCERFAVEFDCMVSEPQQYINTLADMGAKRIIVHLGSTPHLMDAIAQIKERGCIAGVALTNDIPLSELDQYLPHISFVQLMGIATVGAQGQPFDPRTVPRVTALREQYPDLDIAVDGSVNADTIPTLREAGVNRFAPGSAIAGAPDPAAAYAELVALAQSTDVRLR